MNNKLDAYVTVTILLQFDSNIVYNYPIIHVVGTWSVREELQVNLSFSLSQFTLYLLQL